MRLGILLREEDRGISVSIEIADKNIYFIPEILKDQGIYLAERREIN